MQPMPIHSSVVRLSSSARTKLVKPVCHLSDLKVASFFSLWRFAVFQVPVRSPCLPLTNTPYLVVSITQRLSQHHFSDLSVTCQSAVITATQLAIRPPNVVFRTWLTSVMRFAMTSPISGACSLNKQRFHGDYQSCARKLFVCLLETRVPSVTSGSHSTAWRSPDGEVSTYCVSSRI